MSIYIGNLPYEATAEEIKALFKGYGKIVNCHIPKDRVTGRSRGIGFIELEDPAAEVTAISELQSVSLRGRPLLLNKGNRNQGGPRPVQPSTPAAGPRRVERAYQPRTPRVARQPARAEQNRPNDDPRWAAGVPMEYRAQVQGRCQRQRVNKPRGGEPRRQSDVEVWLEEWNAGRSSDVPFQTEGLRILGADQPIQIAWRLVSNSGVDDDLSRPVIGAGGWPLIPGSSIKGLFRRACADDPSLLRWCGGRGSDKEIKPGILRFHGAWPVRDDDEGWQSRLLDVVHPQEKWQVGFNTDQGRNKSSAFSLVSLYRPRLLIAISCTETKISEDEWSEIEATMLRALAAGVGGKTSAGYGAIESHDSREERVDRRLPVTPISAAVAVPRPPASPKRNPLVAFLGKVIRKLLRFLKRNPLLRPWLGVTPMPPPSLPGSVSTSGVPRQPEPLDAPPPQAAPRPAIADLPSGPIFECGIKGQGSASLLLDGTPVFRPSMFRAGIRSMALRLFGGLTDQSTAKQMVGHLFGSLTSPPGQRGPVVGLLRMSYRTDTDGLVSIGPFWPINL